MKKIVLFTSLVSFFLVNPTQASNSTNQTVAYDMASGMPAPNKPTTDSQSDDWGNTNISPTTSNSNNVGDGFAVGTQFGISTAMVALAISNNDNQSRGLNLGYLGGLHADYGYSFAQSWYLGAEIYGNLENLSQKTYDNSTVTTLTVGDNYGAVFLPGFHFSPNNLFYAKLGANVAKLTFTCNGGSSSWRTGSDVGLGFRQGLTDNLSLGLEYDWINYFSTLSAPAAIGVLEPSTARFTQNIYQASLSYQFDSIDNKNNQAPLNLTGFYAGGTVGARSQIFHNEFSFTDNSGTGSDHFQSNGAAERLKLGYGYQFSSHYYLGAEAFGGTAQNLKPRQFNRSFNTETISYGASLLPGYVINQSNMLYGRVGYIRTHFSNYNGVTSGGAASDYSQDANGAELGLGYEVALMKNLSLIVEGDYDHYAPFTAAASGTTQVNRYSISDTMASVGLNYRF